VTDQERASGSASRHCLQMYPLMLAAHSHCICLVSFCLNYFYLRRDEKKEHACMLFFLPLNMSLCVLGLASKASRGLRAKHRLRPRLTSKLGKCHRY